LIDFTSYGTKESPARNILLAELYEKYKSKGFEIYQISLDTDEHFWKNASVNLPWVCVWDQQSVNSDILRKYNVSEIPTSFIRNREGELVSRIESYNQLEKDIASVIGH
jgi:alkyl hydroperoxide reductase subunit AhpC